MTEKFDFQAYLKEMQERFEKVKALDSMVFVEIPQPQLTDDSDYQRWLVGDVEIPWMVNFNKNMHYRPEFRFGPNEEDGIHGKFGNEEIDHCKWYRFDGTYPPLCDGDWRAKRGILVRDHYSYLSVVYSQIVSDNLVEYLKQQKIEHRKFNFDKETRNLIVQ